MNWFLWEDPEITQRWRPRMASANKRRSTEVRWRSRSERHSANIRRNASRSIAWKLCWEHGYSYGWTKDGNVIICTMHNIVISCRIRIEIIFQKQLDFYVENQGSVKFFQGVGKIIRPSDNSKWSARMWRIDSDRSWKVDRDKAWSSEQKWGRQERSTARHSWLVTVLHR